MLGILVLCSTLFITFSLVKNALFGKQVSSDSFTGTIDVIVPVSGTDTFHPEQWSRALLDLRSPFVKIYILIDGHHPFIEQLNNFAAQFTFVEIHSFLTRPENTEATTWMISQISHRLSSEVVVIADPELIPSGTIFHSIAKMTKEKDRVYLTLPQTGKSKVVNEAIATLHPNLIFASLFGMQKYRFTLTLPIISLTRMWIAMPLQTFKELPSQNLRGQFKESFYQHWFDEKKAVSLAFGEKHLLRDYPIVIEEQLKEFRDFWSHLWNLHSRKSFAIMVYTLVVWSFPLICFAHPFWAMGSIFLLVLYRFFSKIVFQESWTAAILHPLATIISWAGLFWWIYEQAGPKKIRR
jgi:hypothetical protein